SQTAATWSSNRPLSVQFLSTEALQDTPVPPAVGVPQPAFDRAFERVIAIDVQPPGIRMNPASKPPNGLISDGPNSAAELAGDQVGIEVASREKFRVPADLNQPPVIEHDDRVRVAHRRQPMPDHDLGA